MLKGAWELCHFQHTNESNKISKNRKEKNCTQISLKKKEQKTNKKESCQREISARKRTLTWWLFVNEKYKKEWEKKSKNEREKQQKLFPLLFFQAFLFLIRKNNIVLWNSYECFHTIKNALAGRLRIFMLDR